MSWSKFGSHVKELRIHLCQTGGPSKGVREFITKNYVQMKSANPKLPILIRECSGVQPRLWARFEKGKECSTSLTDLEPNYVKSKLEELLKK